MIGEEKLHQSVYYDYKYKISLKKVQRKQLHPCIKMHKSNIKIGFKLPQFLLQLQTGCSL